MRSSPLTSFCLVLGCALSAGLRAQGRVGPGFFGAPRKSAAFSPLTLGNGITQVGHLSLVPHPNGDPDLFLGGMTVTGLSASLGGAGGWDVVALTYDRALDRVTLNANAAALNSSGPDLSLNWAPDGTYAVVDLPGRVAGNHAQHQTIAREPAGVLEPPTYIGMPPPYWCRRAVPGRVNGKRVLFYEGWCSIDISEHDVERSVLLDRSYAVAQNPDCTHSRPWPIHGPFGEAAGLLVTNENWRASWKGWEWYGDLSPATPAVFGQPLVPHAIGGGSFIPGRIYMAGSDGVYEYDVAGTLSHTALCAGDRAVFTAFAPPRPTQQDVSFFFLAGAFLPAPVPFGPLGNLLGLDPGTLFMVGSAEHDRRTGWAVALLTLPGAIGKASVPLQTLTASFATRSFVFGSTATLTVMEAGGKRSAEVLTEALNLDHYESVAGEPGARIELPDAQDATKIEFAAPTDPLNPWVKDRDFAAVQRADGRVFLDVQRPGGLIVQVTTPSFVKKVFFVKSKLAFTARSGFDYKLLPPVPLDPKYLMPNLLRCRPDGLDNGYLRNLRLMLPNAFEFSGVASINAEIERRFKANNNQPIDVTLLTHGSQAWFQTGSVWNAATRRLDYDAVAIDANNDPNANYKAFVTANRGKIRKLVIFACMVVCPGTTGLGPKFQDKLAEDLKTAGAVSLTAWDVCSYATSPWIGWLPAGGWFRPVYFPPMLGIAGGRAPREISK